MYAKFKIKVLNNSRLYVGIKNNGFPQNFFYGCVTNGHSKRKMLEIFNLI